jgi:hypothetical protein
VIVDVKHCSACKIPHPVAAFGLDRSRGDGLRTVCRASRKVARATDVERFTAKTTVSPTGCLLWTGGTYPSGYGSFWFRGRAQGAHRVAWILADGPLDEDDCVLHCCDVPLCVKRDHLFLGDRADNAADMTSKGRRASQPGEANGRAKLTAGQVVRIRELAGPVSQRELARRYGVSKGLIRKIVHREIWVEGPHRFPGVQQRSLREYPQPAAVTA